MTDITNMPAGYFDVLDARHPHWSDSECQTITLEVFFGWAGESGTYIPFTASLKDSEVHGRQLFADAKAGKYGEVAPPPVVTIEAVQAEMALRIREATAALCALSIRQETLQDALALGMAAEDTQAELDTIGASIQAWKMYRVKVSQVPLQAGFPQAVAWPDAPEMTAENEAAGGEADE